MSSVAAADAIPAAESCGASLSANCFNGADGCPTHRNYRQAAQVKVVTKGTEPGIVWAMKWLERRGIEPSMVSGVTVSSAVGAPMTITATMIVRDPDEDFT